MIPVRSWPYATSVSTPGASDEARIAAANAYIEALVTHQADAVPFTPECVRIEQGVKTGFSGDHFAAQPKQRSAVPPYRRRVQSAVPG